MQRSIERKLAFFFIKGMFLVVVIVLALLCFTIEEKYLIFYFMFIVLIGITCSLGLSLVVDFLKIQKYDWFNEKTEQLELNEVDLDLALKVCLRYRNGATYSMIRQEFNLIQNTQVMRLIRQGLDILLKEHDCNSRNK